MAVLQFNKTLWCSFLLLFIKKNLNYESDMLMVFFVLVSHLNPTFSLQTTFINSSTQIIDRDNCRPVALCATASQQTPVTNSTEWITPGSILMSFIILIVCLLHTAEMLSATYCIVWISRSPDRARRCLPCYWEFTEGRRVKTETSLRSLPHSADKTLYIILYIFMYFRSTPKWEGCNMSNQWVVTAWQTPRT